MSPELRPLLAHACIAVSACVGAWLVLNQPLEKEIAEIAERVTAESPGQSDQLHALAQALAMQSQRLRSEIGAVQARNLRFTHTSEVYTRIRDIARERGIQVVRLSPGTTVEDEASRCTAQRYYVSLEGELEATIAMLEELADSGGFLRFERADMAPLQREGGQLVATGVELTTLTFDMPASLAAFAEGVPNASE
jgi:hypothetical protein